MNERDLIFFSTLSDAHGGPFHITHTVNPLSTETQPDAELSIKGEEGLTMSLTLERPLTPVEIAILTGMRVITLPKWLMAEPIGVEPVRRHKRKRIAKKWARRYGYKTVYGPERSFIKNDILFVGPDTYKKIKEKVK